MSDVSGRYRRLADAFTRHVAQVPPQRWSAPSPCEGWTARDVVRHVVETQGVFLGLVGRRLGDIPSVDDDPLAAWTAARDVVQADLDDSERATAEFEGSFGPTTFGQAVDDFLCFDLVVHRWDLARAVGLDERLAPEEIRFVGERAAALGDAAREIGRAHV